MKAGRLRPVRGRRFQIRVFVDVLIYTFIRVVDCLVRKQTDVVRVLMKISCEAGSDSDDVVDGAVVGWNVS